MAGFSGMSRQLFNAYPYPAWVVEGRQRRILAVNAAAVEVYGIDPATFVSLHLAEDGPSRSPSRPMPASGEDCGSIRRHRDRHGARLWVEVVETPLREDADGACWLVWARNVTDRHLGEDRLRLLEAAVEATGEIIIVTSSWRGAQDRAPAVVYANSALERVTGWPAESLLGRSLLQLVHVDTDRQSLDAIRHALDGGTATALEVHVRHRSGAGLWMEVSLSPHRDVDGQDGHYVWTLRDVTRRRLLQEQLLHATGMDAVGRVAGSLTHDFNNLLTIVANSTQLARQRMPADDVLAGYLQEIEMATDRAHGLTGQLLAISRTGGLRPEIVDPAATIQELVPLLRRLAGPAVDLALGLPTPGPLIRADTSHIEQLVLNLVANARDALPEGGGVSVSVSVSGDEARIVVRDTGCGMDTVTLKRAAEAFFTTKPRGRGTGLGLSAARMIAEQYGGRLHVESEVGQGTTITVAFPVSATPAAAVVPPRPITRPPSDGPVLLVEDEPSLRGLLAVALRETGFSVREDDGSETDEALVAGGPYRLVVSDLNLGFRMASELLLALRNAQPTVPILFISGDGAAAARVGLTPPVCLLSKPFNLTEFSEAIQKTLTEAERAPGS